MDIISHGLWGGIAFGKKNRRNFWTAFSFGILPDVITFGLPFLGILFGYYPRPDFLNARTPSEDIFPSYIQSFYNIAHSLVVFLVIFGLVWIVRRKPFLPLAAWGLHILIDIPTHSFEFFPTPFLWPLSGYMVNGVMWGTLWIIVPDIILLIILYGWYFIAKKRKKSAAEMENH